MEVQLFEGIEPDPSVETVMKRRGSDAQVPARLDRCNGRRFPYRCCKGYVDQTMNIRILTFEDMCKVFGFPKLRTEGTLLRYPLHFRHCYRSNCFLHHHRLPARASSILSLTSRSPRMLQSLTLIWHETMPQEAGCSHRYGCYDPRHRGVCFHRKLRLYRPAGSSCHRDDS